MVATTVGVVQRRVAVSVAVILVSRSAPALRTGTLRASDPPKGPLHTWPARSCVAGLPTTKSSTTIATIYVVAGVVLSAFLYMS